VAFAVQEVASVQHVGPMDVEGAEAYAKRSARFPFGTGCRAPLCRAAKLSYGRGEGQILSLLDKSALQQSRFSIGAAIAGLTRSVLWTCEVLGWPT
jgi:hypothetical protein